MCKEICIRNNISPSPRNLILVTDYFREGGRRLSTFLTIEDNVKLILNNESTLSDKVNFSTIQQGIFSIIEEMDDEYLLKSYYTILEYFDRSCKDRVFSLSALFSIGDCTNINSYKNIKEKLNKLVIPVFSKISKIEDTRNTGLLLIIPRSDLE